METQQLAHVCSIRHLHNLHTIELFEPAFDIAIKASFSVRDSEGQLWAIPDPACICFQCQSLRVSPLKRPAKNSKVTFRSWKYRLLLIVTDEGKGRWIDKLKKYGFIPIQEYVGYEDGTATIWTLHIPTYIEQNKFGWNEDSYLLPKKKDLK